VAVALDGAAAAGAAAATDSPHITIRGLAKRFGEAVVYDRFDLDLARGKFTSVFGPNGCGKSTLINMIAGLVSVDAGSRIVPVAILGIRELLPRGGFDRGRLLTSR